MAWWKSLLTWFVKSGAAEALGKAAAKKIAKNDPPKESE